VSEPLSRINAERLPPLPLPPDTQAELELAAFDTDTVVVALPVPILTLPPVLSSASFSPVSASTST